MPEGTLRGRAATGFLAFKAAPSKHQTPFAYLALVLCTIAIAVAVRRGRQAQPQPTAWLPRLLAPRHPGRSGGDASLLPLARM